MDAYCFFIAAGWGDAAVPKHFKALAQHLVKRGHRVVYLPHGQRVLLDEENFHVRSFPSPRPTKLRDFIYLHKLVRQYHPDCMVANFGAGNVMTIVGWLNRVPCRINWYHSYSKAFELEASTPYWKRVFFVLRKRLVYGLASDMVAVSDATRVDLLSTYKISHKKSCVIYNSLSDPLEHPEISSALAQPQIITCVGGLFPWKGQDIRVIASK